LLPAVAAAPGRDRDDRGRREPEDGRGLPVRADPPL